MSKVGLQKASELTGKSRSTIHRAMNLGKLSYSTNASGEREVDIAELERVYGITLQPERNDTQLENEIVELRTMLAIERERNDMQRTVISLLEKQIEDLRNDRDRWHSEYKQSALSSKNSFWKRLVARN